MAIPMAGRPGSSTVIDTCRKCRKPIVLAGGDWADADGTTCCYADLSAPYTPHEPSRTITAGTIIPATPNMRLLLLACDVAGDSLEADAEGDCSDCVPGGGKCLRHEAAADEADRIKALRDRLALARSASEVAALLAGTKRAA